MQQRNEKLKYYNELLERYGKYIWLKSKRANVDTPYKTDKDIVQDISYTIWKILENSALDVFRNNEKSLVCGVTHNMIIMHYRKNKLEVKAKKNMDLPMGTYEQNEEGIVAELRKLMPTKDRDLLDLYLQGFTLDEIAMVLGKTPTAIRKQKTRIIEKMKNIYNKLYNK